MSQLLFLPNKIRGIWRFVRFVALRFLEDDCAYRASALAFTSILAIVPLMSVGIAILSSFPVFHTLSLPLQNFVFENFVPATGKIIQGYLQQFSSQIAMLPIGGIIFLFITALLTMVTIERAMNQIWKVHIPREGVSAFLLYWSILSLAPIFLGLSLAYSSYILSVSIKGHLLSFPLLNIIPFLLSLIGFTFLYVIVPNHTIRLRYGLAGGLIAALLFELAKQTFAFYLKHYHTYELLYGAFATIPIFFIWVYWVWMITLLGAEVSYAFSVAYQRRPGIPLEPISHALLWLRHFWLAQKTGQVVTVEALINSTHRPFTVEVNDMLSLLTDRKLIEPIPGKGFILNRDLEDLSLYNLLEMLPYHFPTDDALLSLAADDLPWKTLFYQNNQALKQRFLISLEEIFKKTSP